MKHLKTVFKQPPSLAAAAVFIFGLFVHMFGLTNTLHNYDNIAVEPQGVGTTLPSGRWFLYVLQVLGEKLFGNFNLPWFDGVLFLLLLSVSAALLVSTLNIKKWISAIFIGCGLVSFPTVTSILFFKFTAPQYGLAILLSVLAVWIIDKQKYAFFLSAVLISMAVGTYQAYFSVSVTVCLLLLIRYALEKGTTLVAIIKRGFFYLMTLMGGLVTYFVILKVFLKVKNVVLLDYQGISSMGSLEIAELPSLLWRAFTGVVLLPFRDYCGLATSGFLRVLYLFLWLLSAVIIIFLIIKNRKKLLEILAVLLLCLLFPIGGNLIVLMGSDWIYTLMVFSFSLILCIPCVLWELVPADEVLWSRLKTGVGFLAFATLAGVIFSNTYFANVNYSYMYYSNRQVENFYATVSTQIHMADGYNIEKKWAFVGKAGDRFFNESKWVGKHRYGGNVGAANLVNQYSAGCWIQNYLGHHYLSASQEETQALSASPEVKAMPCWPDEGSVKVVGDYVVVKLSN